MAAGRLRGAVPGGVSLPPEITVLLVMLAVATVLGGIEALFPPHPQTPLEIHIAAMAAIVPLSALVWFLGPRWPTAVIHSTLGFLLVVVTVIGVNAATPVGAVSLSHSFVWVCIYVAMFRSRAAARLYVLLCATGFGIALWASVGGRIAWSTWLVIVVTLLVGTELLARVAQRLRGLSTTDPLTGALNRYGLEREVVTLRAAQRREGGSTSVVAIDLDGFKAINDRLGHAAGDAALVQLVSVWLGQLRPRDLVCRYGGDEFVLVLPQTRPDDVEAVLARLRGVSPVPWSAGVAGLDPEEDLHEAIRRADREMYVQRIAERTDARSGSPPAPANPPSGLTYLRG